MIFGLAGGADGVAADKGETCTKVRHSKIVWVKVKRGGKWVRVKHRKVWWSCDPYEAPGPPRLGVIAREYRFTFTRPYVKAGKLILQLDNQGEDVHNLKIGKVSSKLAFAVVPDTEPRAQSTIEVPLKPGTYRLWCSLPKHEKLGMKTTLKVVARDH
jgi:hypothetical protein